MALNGIDGLIIDLDGTIYLGSQAIEGAKETMEHIRAAGIKVVFLSNRGNYSRRMCQEKLEAMGIPAAAEEIILTSSVTATYLLENEPDGKAWLFGDEGLHEELRSHGVQLAAKPEEADWLVITLHESLTYAELNDAFRAARSGAKLIVTNEDKTFPGDGGECIDVGATIAAIVHTTGAEVSVVVGKPSAYMANAALRALDLPPERCLVIGDSLHSDIALGKRAGIRTALVLSGSTTRERGEAAEERPDFIWDSISDIRTLLQSDKEERQ
ncbi:HAD-IIA family hydrolase [Cohnella sp. LGH]|uniref:Acid sugar phosphatase n=1 Tax=Cohnella phaseoli TaxID=456490 RepID=A0A3D9I4I4_9BACL|nr:MULTISPECIES: HAD-IIA family hydrolase [Cohnella]QTH42456.1 HAD-IIA family hydrolase [Cohnella sp. LGH]RED56667.1 arabinose operon protein AraL [Cohnella phaseoli]